MSNVIEKDGKFFEKGNDGLYHEIPEQNFVPAEEPKKEEPQTFTGQLWNDDKVDLGSKIIGSIASVPMDLTVRPFIKAVEAIGDKLFGQNDKKEEEKSK